MIMIGKENLLMDEWIDVNDKLPEDGTYLVTMKSIINTPVISICSFAKDLYLVNEYDFFDKKGKSGWYNSDNEYGFYENDRVIAWMPLPKPYI